MKLTASGGTDGASIVLFWPKNLPEDGDQCLKDEPVELAERLEEAGDLVRFPCDGDGHYTLAVYLNEDPPADILSAYDECGRYDALHARGDGYFGGMEYMFKRDAALLQKYPGMCTKVGVPEGDYAATVYENDAPDALENEWVRGRVGDRTMRASEAHHIVFVAAIGMVLLSLVGLCTMPWRVWWWFAGASAFLVPAAVAASRSAAWRAVAAARREYEDVFPSYVLYLRDAAGRSHAGS